MGAGVAAAAGMSPDTAQHSDLRRDGFGVRRFDSDPQDGRVEVLTVAPLLSSAAGEQAIRSRAARFPDGQAPVLTPLHGVTRVGDTLEVTTGAPDGVTLGDLLGRSSSAPWP